MENDIYEEKNIHVGLRVLVLITYLSNVVSPNFNKQKFQNLLVKCEVCEDCRKIPNW